ncbi:hypothetical protein [Bacillus sp. FJAT-45350]|uniref:hypothetical protein n=1 Tax=Bacillus sp. FJAT-45350 TaxID=2011014 RepID=UPI000BB85404|nr:hypothetical protein [Bacillus sp. FJAT-45350]
MKIIESLDLVYEKESLLKSRFNIHKSHVMAALDGVHSAIEWLKTSIYRSVLSDVSFYITDEPINFPGELMIHEKVEFQPVIYLNIMTIAEDYQNEEYLLEVKKKDISCFEYAAFVLLHEFGHLIHGLIGGNGKKQRDRLFDYFDRGEYYYTRFIQTMNKGETYEEKKRYRNIPHEKAADRFARQNLKIMMEHYK